MSLQCHRISGLEREELKLKEEAETLRRDKEDLAAVRDGQRRRIEVRRGRRGEEDRGKVGRGRAGWEE